YDQAANLTKTEFGSVTTMQNSAVVPDNWQGFTVLKEVHSTYDSWGKRTSTYTKAGGKIQTLTQYSYDNVGRVLCEARRMNEVAFNNFPNSACSLGGSGK